MEKILKKANFYFYAALICAVWFSMTSYFWAYYANLFFSLPFAILSLVLRHYGLKIDENPGRYKLVLGILVVGVLISFGFLIFMVK